MHKKCSKNEADCDLFCSRHKFSKFLYNEGQGGRCIIYKNMSSSKIANLTKNWIHQNCSAQQNNETESTMDSENHKLLATPTVKLWIKNLEAIYRGRAMDLKVLFSRKIWQKNFILTSKMDYPSLVANIFHSFYSWKNIATRLSSPIFPLGK